MGHPTSECSDLFPHPCVIYLFDLLSHQLMTFSMGTENVKEKYNLVHSVEVC